LITGKRVFARHRIRGWLVAFGVLITPGLVRGQTVEVPNLSLDGARAVLHAAEQKAQQLTAPSSLAVVGPAGDLILFEQALEAAINIGRPAAITAQQMQMQGGVPIRVAGAVVGPLALAGSTKRTT
jgi:uncharacterized protein GlcG (DUF336 family)